MVMKVTTSGFSDTGNIMIIPVFEGSNKAPNYSTNLIAKSLFNIERTLNQT